ncbi:hypothetical protein [Moorena producens]|uniref:hypothetical protein n=1 Tax=Moorena producens TaxID=1155739 RepID=UPI003C7517E3
MTVFSIPKNLYIALASCLLLLASCLLPQGLCLQLKYKCENFCSQGVRLTRNLIRHGSHRSLLPTPYCLLPTPYSLGALSVGELNSPRVAPLPTPFAIVIQITAIGLENH